MNLPDWLWLLLAILAAYRVAYLFTNDTGPWRIFARLRALVVTEFGPASWQAEGARCLFCQSVWYAFVVAVALYFIDLLWVQLAVLWLGIAGAVLVLHWLVLGAMTHVREA